MYTTAGVAKGAEPCRQGGQGFDRSIEPALNPPLSVSVFVPYAYVCIVLRRLFL